MVTSPSTGALFWCLLVLLAAPDTTTAQQEVPDLDALRTPPTPAFAVLDIEPSAVERPATPSDVAMALVNDFRDGAVPKNFAFESSPYWLVSRPHVTWRDDAQRAVGQSLARTTSVSVATAETGAEIAPVTSLAFGFRTLIFSGRLAPQTIKALENLERRLAENGAVFLSLMREHGLSALETELLDCTIPRPPSLPPSEGAKEKCVADYETKKRELTDIVLQSDAFKRASAPLTGAGNVVPKREGFFLEVAGAVAWDFADADWEAQEFRKRAIWVTPSYASGGWAALGVIRYEDARATEDAVDWGGRVVYSASNYAVSLEYVERSPIDSATLTRSHRLIGTGEYRVTSGTWIVASFGKDRQKTAETANTLIAQLGLSFNFSKERYKFPTATP
jgi:hypothetical protein